MIRFSIRCDHGHDFDAWFSKGADFDEQASRKLIACPQCGSTAVEKALMAPAVPAAPRAEDKTGLAMSPAHREQLKKIKEMVAAIRSSSEDVGERFPEEARRIHYGEADHRGIIGRADPDEARALLEEGISVAPLPHFPDDAN
ncbi:DUF1178 family protein [Pararhizobium haloflavum]|uniref:DUF1178 family protein n=1 Tax=Pararhizobium haloflavum TaxID=2037914 RepID=UPI000C18B0F9|nr:DUF1178 family protein [Pararhizobium haloflavum]